jgi:hypothetical protein
MTTDESGAVTVASTFTAAMNRGAHEEASRLLADDVELVFPGTRLQGRDAWLESRRRQQPPEHLVEHVEPDTVSATTEGAEVSGRLVQRWVETDEVAGELPVRISFAVAGGLITRLEFMPGSPTVF